MWKSLQEASQKDKDYLRNKYKSARKGENECSRSLANLGNGRKGKRNREKQERGKKRVREKRTEGRKEGMAEVMKGGRKGYYNVLFAL